MLRFKNLAFKRLLVEDTVHLPQRFELIFVIRNDGHVNVLNFEGCHVLGTTFEFVLTAPKC